MTDALDTAADMLDAVAAAPPDWWADGARPEQVPPPGDWSTWLVVAGRGFGKTRTGSEWAWRQARLHGPTSRGALVAPTAADVRDVVVEGESGVLACCPDSFRPLYEPSKRRLTYPNGAQQFTYSADEPERLRGPQHHYAWIDEWAAMRLTGSDMLDMLLLGLRLGLDPKLLITTTPRPLPWLRKQMDDPRTVVTGGSTYDNLSNLAPTFRDTVVARFIGTRLGKQELEGVILQDVEGALWSQTLLDAGRVQEAPAMSRVVVAIDPATTSHEGSDETGIVVCGQGRDGDWYVLEDCSGKYSPDGWARTAIDAFDRHGADRVIVEKNQGGDMVSAVLRSVRQTLAIETVWASRGKQTRAEPIAALFEQHRAHLVGRHDKLEDQLTTWSPGDTDSPDRVDAMVWGLTALSTHSNAAAYLERLAQMCPSCNYPNQTARVACEKCGHALHRAGSYSASD